MTVPGNLKPFGAQDRPLVLDVSQLARRVQWAVGKNVLVLRINSKVRTPYNPTASVIVSDGAYTGEVYVTTINEHDDKVPYPDISLPKISKEMFAHTLEFNKSPPLKKLEFETLNSYTQLIFMNLRRVLSFNDFKDDTYQLKITFPPSVRRTTTDIAYWFFEDAFGNGFDYEYAHPHTVGVVVDALGHIEVWSVPTVLSKARRDEILSYNGGITPGGFNVFDEPISSTRNDLAQWKIEAWTFKGRDEFPVNLTDYSLAFDTNDDKNKGYKTDHAGSNVDEITPSYTVTIRVNFKTLALELTKA